MCNYQDIAVPATGLVLRFTNDRPMVFVTNILNQPVKSICDLLRAPTGTKDEQTNRFHAVDEGYGLHGAFHTKS